MNLQGDTSDVYTPIDFSKIRVGLKTLQDATIDIGSYRRINPRCGDKDFVLTAINNGNIDAMREISNFFYKTSGIYNRMCRYMAYIYRYDWMITPIVNRGLSVVPKADKDLTETNKNKALEDFFKILKTFDEFNVKKFCGDVALKVIRNGCYYGYLIPTTNGKISVQELPPRYCRARFCINEQPVVQFNMSFFDDFYLTVEQRTKVLNLFPDEFKKGYRAYKQGKLNGRDFPGDTSGWYTLDPNSTIKFNINGDDYPLFIAAIPTLIDLDVARDLDQKRIAQKLLRIIIQKMPLDKNGDSVFDIDEAKELHNNAVKMLKKSIGTDVLTTFADVDVADMSDKSNTTQSDDVNRVKMSVFDEFGTSVDNFNSTSNAALKYSDLNDASNMYNLLQQFEGFLNRLLKPYNTNSKRVYYTAQILETTNSNYQDMAKLYREQTQLGFSKMLPQIALGQSESSILATAYWENEILNLIEVFVPPISSATMNADTLQALTGKSADNNAAAAGQSSGSSQIQSDSKAGRPEKADEDKSDKTIANRESL